MKKCLSLNQKYENENNSTNAHCCVVICSYKLDDKGDNFMALVPAICTQCGAQIEVDDTHEAGVCNHCGTAFITEKAINNYT